jgi:hypothetical protein
MRKSLHKQSCPFCPLAQALLAFYSCYKKCCCSLQSLPHVNTVPLCIISVSGLATVDTKDTQQQCYLVMVLIVTDDTDYVKWLESVKRSAVIAYVNSTVQLLAKATFILIA